MEMENYTPYQSTEGCRHGYCSSDNDNRWSKVEGSAVDPALLLTPPTGWEKQGDEDFA